MSEDRYSWLEDVEGDRPLEWVRERNALAEEVLAASPRFREIEEQTLEVLDSEDRIPAVVQRGEYLYNFWIDGHHERGLWRRTTWDSYRTATPEWEVLVDIDELGRAEGVNWVWHGAEVLYPSRERALISLSSRPLPLSTRSLNPIENSFRRSARCRPAGDQHATPPAKWHPDFARRSSAAYPVVVPLGAAVPRTFASERV